MKRFAWISIGIALAAISLTGCSWETGSDAESWSSSYDWVNFSGVYRGIGGGLLVTDYTTTPSTPGTTNTLPYSENEGALPATVAVGSGIVKMFSSPVRGSASITIGDTASLSDLDGSGNLTGSGTGHFNYESGVWSFELGPGSIDFVNARSIVVSYSYDVSSGGSPSSGARPGSTGSIYSFDLQHQGENLTMTDNNGAVYTGIISKMASASGAQNTDIGQVGGDESGNDTSQHAKYTYYESPLPEDGDSITASFEVSGVSAAAMSVRIVGTLEGSVTAGNFTSRRLDGTWIEVGGKTGDVNGQTETVAIAVPAEEAPADEVPEG